MRNIDTLTGPRRVLTAGALVVLGGLAAGGCAETSGPGSAWMRGSDCDPTTTTRVFDTAAGYTDQGFSIDADSMFYGINDMSADASISDGGRIEDKLTITAVGVEGDPDVDETIVRELVFEGEDIVIEQVEPLPFDQTQEADEEYRVDVAELRARPAGHRKFSFWLREGVSRVFLTVRPDQDPANGATLTIDNDCEPAPEVSD